MISPLDQNALDKFKALVATQATVHKMILFGSRARGQADPQSDMDVLVVLDGPVGDEIRDYVSDCAWEAGFEHGIVLVPMVFSRSEWEDGPERHSLLVQAIQTEGLPV